MGPAKALDIALNTLGRRALRGHRHIGCIATQSSNRNSESGLRPLPGPSKRPWSLATGQRFATQQSSSCVWNRPAHAPESRASRTAARRPAERGRRAGARRAALPVAGFRSCISRRGQLLDVCAAFYAEVIDLLGPVGSQDAGKRLAELAEMLKRPKLWSEPRIHITRLPPERVCASKQCCAFVNTGGHGLAAPFAHTFKRQVASVTRLQSLGPRNLGGDGYE